MRSPAVASVQEVVHLRKMMNPFRESVKKRGRGSLVWHHGPVELEEMWNRFQNVVVEIWDRFGEGRSNGKLQLKRIQTLYESHALVRRRHLEYWERQHMRAHDRPQVHRRGCCIARPKSLLVKKLLLRWHKTLTRHQLLEQKQRQKQLERQRKRERLARQKRNILERKEKMAESLGMAGG